MLFPKMDAGKRSSGTKFLRHLSLETARDLRDGSVWFNRGANVMKMKQGLACVIALLLWTNAASAQGHNWVTGFLNRYRPVSTDASLGLVPQPNAPLLRSQIQNGVLPLTVDGLIRLLLQ